MASDVSLTVGAQILFNVAANYSPTALNDIELGTATDVDWDWTGVLTLEARQSDKVDLGATRAPEYSVQAALEFATAPVTGETVDFYWAPSISGTAATGNPGFVTGVDADYAGGVADLAEGLKQLMFIGSLVCSADATTSVQVGQVGVFSSPTRYGTLVVVNNTSDTAGDDVESAVSFTPIIPQGS